MHNIYFQVTVFYIQYTSLILPPQHNIDRIKRVAKAALCNVLVVPGRCYHIGEANENCGDAVLVNNFLDSRPAGRQAGRQAGSVGEAKQPDTCQSAKC